MAELVLGLASSHSPQLSTPAEGWAGRGERDKGHVELIGTDGITSNFEDLLARTDTERIAREITPAKFEQRHAQNQKAIAHLAKKLNDANLDVLVMVGDDQHEYLLDDNMPAFCVYWGDQVKVSGHEAGPSTGGEHLIGYSTEDVYAPTDAALGLHIIDSLMDAEFDVGSSKFLNPDRGGRAKGGIGHAFGYVYNRLMTDGIIPAVPVMLNTYYPPNQPTPKRCFNLGQALRSAIESWPKDIRVGILASGGMSHFVVDENLTSRRWPACRPRASTSSWRCPARRSTPAAPKSATGSWLPAPPSTWTWTSSTMSRATAPRPAPGAPWGLPLGSSPYPHAIASEAWQSRRYSQLVLRQTRCGGEIATLLSLLTVTISHHKERRNGLESY